MARKSNKAKLNLTAEQKYNLVKLSQARTVPLQEVQRSSILLKYADGLGISVIAKELNTTRATVYKCINKALSMGIDAALKDIYHRPYEPIITEEAKNWVISLACTKPKSLGYAAEFWTRHSLAQHVKSNALANGHPCLQKANKATIHRIISAHPIRPDKIAYYCCSRDPDFDKKMHEVLMVYREVSMNQGNSENSLPIITVSVDEKPGVQKLLIIWLKIFYQAQTKIREYYEIINIKGWEPSQFWHPLICKMGMLLPKFMTDIAVGSL